MKSFDGPGFADGFWQGDEDVSKITNYIPKDSIVGRVLDHREQTKILDAEAVVSWAQKTGAVVVAENHNRNGGLYDAVTQVLSEEYPVPCRCVAVEDEFGEVGPQGYLQKRFGLTAEHIVEQTRAVLERRNSQCLNRRKCRSRMGSPKNKRKNPAGRKTVGNCSFNAKIYISTSF